MEREHSSHDGRQRCGDLWIAYVGLAGLAVHIKLMDLRVERAADLRHVPGELDGCASGSYLDLLKSLVCQPVGYCLDVRFGRAELLAKLFGRKPVMKIRRVLAQLLVHEFAERGLLFGTALQDEHHSLHGCCVAHQAMVKFRAGEGVDVAAEAHEFRFVDGLGEARGDGWGLRRGRPNRFRLGLRGGAEGWEREKCSKKEKGIAKHQRLEFHNPSALQI